MELIAQHLQHHNHADTLETSGGRTRAGTNEHQTAQNDPRDVRPHGSIVVEQARGGDERHHLEQGRAERPFQAIAVARHQQISYPRGGNEDNGNVKLKLGTLEQRAWLELEDGHIEHHEVDTCQELEDNGNILHGGRLEELRRIIVRGETTRSGGGHSVVDAVEPTHAGKIEREDATDGQSQIDRPNPLGHGGQAGVHLGAQRSCGFGSKHLHAAATHHRGQDGNGEEHNSQTSNPLGLRAPIQRGMWKPFHIVQNGGSRGGETGHGFEEGVGDIADIATDEERQHAEQTENNPGDGDQQEGVTTAQIVVGIVPQIFQYKATASSKNRRDNKGNEIVFLIKESNACTDK